MEQTVRTTQPTFSVCIPLYNRAQHLRALLDSILSQDFQDFNIVMAEDLSPQRDEIRAIVEQYESLHPGRISYHENQVNLGYDRNIRRLIELASGRYCFFMGNDDILCPGSFAEVANLIAPGDIGLVLKSYAWFDETPDRVNQEVRYFAEYRRFEAGREAISVCFRRSGVISGYVINREAALSVATDRFDGGLYYQLYLTGSVLAKMAAVNTPKVLVLCRNSEPPDFGNSASEKKHFRPGAYTPEARLRMVGSALEIAKYVDKTYKVDVFEDIRKDYGNYFYPYIKDQLKLPFAQFFSLYRKFCGMGFAKYPLFHAYFILGYLLGEEGFDTLSRKFRGLMGRSPQLGVGNVGRVQQPSN